jgi:large conductance mechanosensitive channel
VSILKEFKEFAVKGNVIDLAVGVVIGAAFGKIVSSLVADVITPAIGLLVGGVDFADLKIVIREAIDSTPAVTINYGVFLQQVFDFTIIAFAIFIFIKGFNTLKKKEAAAPASPNRQEILLEEIRDLLKK